jgi:hypothetical protein
MQQQQWRRLDILPPKQRSQYLESNYPIRNFESEIKWYMRRISERKREWERHTHCTIDMTTTLKDLGSWYIIIPFVWCERNTISNQFIRVNERFAIDKRKNINKENANLFAFEAMRTNECKYSLNNEYGYE